MTLFKRYWGLFLVLLLSLFSILPFFNSGFFPMHDDTQVARVYQLGKALKDGMFPVRWASDLGYGYGYPIFNFYAPLAYYLGGFFNFLGLDALLSTKLMMILGIFLSGISMYLLTREFFGEIGGVISGLFYLYAPYHAVDIYVRGDVGEFWAYAFIPLVFYSFYKFGQNVKFNLDQTIPKSNIKNQISKIQIKDQKEIWRWVTIGSITYSGIILSHNLTALMVTPFLVIISLFYWFTVYRSKRYIIHNSLFIILPVLLGLLISAFYWLPALSEMQYTNVLSQIGGGADYKDHFVCIQQLWNSPWGFGGSTPGCLDGMSFRVGKLYIIIVLLSLLFAAGLYLRKSHYNDTYHYSSKLSIIIFSIAGFVISVFLMLENSKFIWQNFSFMAFFQYPWRFLLLASFFSSLLAGSFIWILNLLINYSKIKFVNLILYINVGIMILILFYLDLKLFNPQLFLNKTNKTYVNEKYLKWTTSKISDEYMPKDFLKPKSEKEIAKTRFKFDPEVKINSLIDKTQNIVIDLNVRNQTKFYVNIAPFPAWKIFIDDNSEYEKTNQGYNALLFAGHRRINIQFIETPIEKFSNILSLAGVSILVLGIIFFRRKLIL